MSPDILDRLAVYAPTAGSLADEWGPTERAERLAAVLDDPAPERRLRFRPRLRAVPARPIAPIAASVTVLAVAGTLAVVAGGGSDGHPAGVPAGGSATTAAATPQVFHATVATPRLSAHQWAYRALSSYEISAGSEGTPQVYAVWVSRTGSGQRLDTDPATTCSPVRAASHPGLDEPNQAVVDRLPTDPAALKAYLTERVQGSTSREEAIFVAVSDLLRTDDLLASSAQRAALVTVVAGLRRTSVHSDVDERGRSAVRVDFVDRNQRGDEIQSMYFDPHTFQLLEERSSEGPSSAVPSDEPSAPYTSEPSARATSDQQLPAKGSVTVMTAERVVDTLPANCGQK